MAIPEGDARTVVAATSAGGSVIQALRPTAKVRWLEQHFPTHERQKGYAEEVALAVLTNAISQAMKEAGMTKADVAERLNKPRSYVTRVMNGTHNMTARTFGAMLWACDSEIQKVVRVPLGVIEVAEEELADDEALAHTVATTAANSNLAMSA